MKREKKKEPPAEKKKPRDVVLRNIEEENEMFDDHGPVIIGGRGSKPILPKPREEED